jgi:hypothetical protein
MAATQSPYGLRAVNELGGLPYAGSTRQFLINPAGSAANMYNGTVVAVDTSGYVVPVTNVGSNADPFPAGVVGVFVGCSYINAQGQQIYAQYYPTGTTGVVTAYVVDDDRAVFQVQASGSLGQTALGANVVFSAAQTGSTSTGNSTTAVSTTLATTATIAFKVVGFASGPGDAYTDLLVKFNVGSHAYNTGLGVA